MLTNNNLAKVVISLSRQSWTFMDPVLAISFRCLYTEATAEWWSTFRSSSLTFRCGAKVAKTSCKNELYVSHSPISEKHIDFFKRYSCRCCLPELDTWGDSVPSRVWFTPRWSYCDFIAWVYLDLLLIIGGRTRPFCSTNRTSIFTSKPFFQTRSVKQVSTTSKLAYLYQVHRSIYTYR